VTVRTGAIYLVGAGPGDPKLITVRGREILESADAVVHDRLISQGLLELARADARIENVGKAPGREGPSQGEINDLLINLARSGYTVCRLKGGDPFVFGRGGEEVLAGRAAGVYVEVVPGVSSALAGPASAGVPVTHRGLSSSVTVVTGHEEPGARNGSVDWNVIAQVQGSIVIMMGVAHIDAIARALVVSGRSSDESVCVVERATCPNQRVIFGTLGTIGEVAQSSMIENPATIVIGVAVDTLADRAEL
jgi:uroporphyrinogen III methyltransferase/synthase